MAYDIPVTLYAGSTRVDQYGRAEGKPPVWKQVYCSATYSGGSRKTYAGRVVSEHQVVLTTYWRDGIDMCRFCEFGGLLREIVDVIPEGRKKLAHIVTYTTDAGYGQ